MAHGTVLQQIALVINHLDFCSGGSVAVNFLAAIEILLRLFCLPERNRTIALLFYRPVPVTQIRNSAANTTYRADLDLYPIILFRSK